MKNPSIASDTEVTDSQIETCVTLVTDAARKGTGTALRELARNGVLNRTNIECVRARGNEVVADIIALAKKKFAEIAENIAGIVKLISGAETLELDETDGKETIAKANKIFPGGIYGFAAETDAPGVATNKIQVSVHEMIKNGTFAQIFNGMSKDLHSLCLTQPQIIQFMQKHRKWLRTDGYGTFFLFKVGEELFVACVYFDGIGLLGVSAFRVSYDRVWLAEYGRRIVVPQLALAHQS